jgi:EAL domain-containing protein (putative c-di-GMP-specific phosphodiesterase class I)
MADFSFWGSSALLPYLEHFPDPGGPPQRIVLERLPFRIGRGKTVHHAVFCRQVSKEHAEIYRSGEEFRIRDLESTNGTFVNGHRITNAPLVNGDIVHVAHTEFRFGYKPTGSVDSFAGFATEDAGSALPRSVIRGSKHLRELLEQQLVSAVFQPIVYLKTGELLGYESLGRGLHSELSPEPIELLRLAEQCQLAAELSRSFRLQGIKESARLAGAPRLFFNVHPAEMANESLLSCFCESLAVVDDSRSMVLEVHEDVVADVVMLRRLREHLRALGVGLAFDDFGAGQARLAELAEVPPDFVKLDMKLIRGIDQSRARQELVQALARIASDLGVEVIAEGVETPGEAESCLEAGCQLGQGFLFGRPQPVPSLVSRGSSDACDIEPGLHELPLQLDMPD